MSWLFIAVLVDRLGYKIAIVVERPFHVVREREPAMALFEEIIYVTNCPFKTISEVTKIRIGLTFVVAVFDHNSLAPCYFGFSAFDRLAQRFATYKALWNDLVVALVAEQLAEISTADIKIVEIAKESALWAAEHYISFGRLFLEKALLFH